MLNDSEDGLETAQPTPQSEDRIHRALTTTFVQVTLGIGTPEEGRILSQLAFKRAILDATFSPQKERLTFVNFMMRKYRERYNRQVAS